MKTAMKRLLVFLSLLPMAVGAASLGEVKSVYLLPMTHGFDQYLANRLTAAGVFTVTTDPKSADAIFTDRLGEGFQQRLQELYPPAAPSAKPAEESDKAAKSEETTVTPAGDFAPAPAPAGSMSTFGRGKGTLFLVDTSTREILWSTYEEPKANEPKYLDRTAGAVTKRIQKALEGKKP
jgi:hypothetical protein